MPQGMCPDPRALGFPGDRKQNGQSRASTGPTGSAAQGGRSGLGGSSLENVPDPDGKARGQGETQSRNGALRSSHKFKRGRGLSGSDSMNAAGPPQAQLVPQQMELGG